MFTLNSPDLPLLTTLPSAGVPLGIFSVSAIPVTGASFGVINTQLDSPLIVEQAIAIPNYSGDSFTVVAPEDAGDIISVSIQGATYSLSPTPSTPQPGEFVFDYFSRNLTVYPRNDSPVSGSLSLVGLVNTEVEGVPTTEIAGGYPEFFAQWDIEGSVSISRGFKGHPSASLRFTSSRQNTAAIRQGLQNGTPVQLYGVAYLVQSIKIVELSVKKYPKGLVFVDVQLQGKWDGRGSTQRSPLDTALKLKPLVSNERTSLSRLAGAAGVPYSGPEISIKVPRDTPSSTATSVRSELESRAIAVRGFPFYSNPSAVECRRWGNTSVHFLSDTDVLSAELSFDLPGHAALFEGVQLTDEFRNVILNLDSDEIGRNERLVLYEGDPFPNRPPRFADAEPGQPRIPISLRDPSIAYPGGITKTRKKIIYLNDSTIEEEEEVYGFLFCSVDVYDVFMSGDQIVTRYNEGNDQYSIYEQYWEKVREVRTIYHYREDDYLEKIERRGWEKSRFKQEGSSLEALEFRKQLFLGLQEGIDAEVATRLRKIIQMYQYPGAAVPNTQGLPTSASSHRAVILPVNDITEYTLEPLSDYYADILPPERGSTEPAQLFCKQETRTDNSYMLTPDPESTPEEERPPLTTGKKFQETKQIEIVYPRPGGKQTPEIFRENQGTSNLQGAGLSLGLNISYSREFKERPGIHTRITRHRNSLTRPAPSTDHSRYKYLLNSFDFAARPDDPEGGSISFPDISDPEEGRLIAECELSMRNSQGAETITVAVRYNPSYAEGDLIVWRGYLWVCFGVKDNQLIERRQGNPQVKSEAFELALGRFLKPPVQLSRTPRTNE